MRPRQNPQLILREEEKGKYLAFNRENQVPLVLNTTSHAILSLCDGTRDVEEVCEQLRQRFQVDSANLGPQQLRQIVGDHIELMKKVRILIV